MATIKEWKAAKIRLDNARIKLSSAWATLELKAASFRGLSHLKPGSLLIDDGIYHHVDHAPALPTWPTEKELDQILSEFKNAFHTENVIYGSLSPEDHANVER